MSGYESLIALLEARKENASVVAIRELLAERDALRVEEDDMHAVLQRLSDILTRTVEVIKGPPPELTMWGWHDLPDLVDALKAERDAWKHKADLYEKALLDRHGGEPIALLDELDEVRAERDALRKGIKAVEDLINDSSGVAGLHLNGDYASWESLRTGGHFEEWLIDFDNALAAGEER
jgi:uncharacterized coiled-coil DUF342 family protein